jgi:hypothetical protein
MNSDFLRQFRAWATAPEWRGRRYLISPPVDFALVGGLGLLTFFLLFVLLPPTQAMAERWLVAAVVSGLALFIADPHFIASYQLLYKGWRGKLKEGGRAQYRRYIIAGVVVPALLAAYFLYAFITRNDALFGSAIAAMLVLVGWHYVKQAYGVFMLLSSLKEIRYSAWQRRFLLWNSYVAWLFYCCALFTSFPVQQAAGADYIQAPGALAIRYTLPSLPFLQDVLAYLTGITFFLSIMAILVMAWEKPNWSKTAAAGYFSMYYFLLFAGLHPLWILFYPLFHGLQYLLFVYALKRGETRNAREVRVFFGLALVIGILAFAAVPLLLEQMVLLPLTVCAAVFINIHHYFIDSVIWRRENKQRDYVLAVQ